MGKNHDFKLFKNSRIFMQPKIKAHVDTGYQGIKKQHTNSELPKKRSKKNPLTKEDKIQNQKISSSRVLIENIIRELKIFKIIAEKYRNKRKKFTLGLNLIAGLYNF
jgi:hypothetical protein